MHGNELCMCTACINCTNLDNCADRMLHVILCLSIL